jgi:hypothetical protein
MPARIIEELTSRKKEKIATFLTFESIVAVLIGFMPMFMLTSTWPPLSRVPLCAASAVAGYIATVDFHGLPLYEHVMWTARGLFRLQVHGNRVVPEELPGSIPNPEQDRVIVIGSSIEVVQRGSVLTNDAASTNSGPVPLTSPAAVLVSPEQLLAGRTLPGTTVPDRSLPALDLPQIVLAEQVAADLPEQDVTPSTTS